jgi:ERCC4-type nuclease
LASASKRTGAVSTNKSPYWTTQTYGRRTLMYADIENWLRTLELKCPRVRIIKTDNPTETVSQCLNIYHHRQEHADKHKALDVVYHAIAAVPNANPSLLRRIANCFDGIGWSKSGLVEVRFRTIKDMMDATVKDWMEIPGVGKKIASDIHAAIRGEKIYAKKSIR